MRTIAAIATALSPAGIAIVRMSGTDSAAIAARLFHATDGTPAAELAPRVLALGTFAWDGISDRCLCVRFPAPRSFTGEDVVEFHVHGGVKLAETVLDACLANGAALAEPGEFTKRAFLNGKMTLAQAEGTIDTIHASSEAELRAGYRLVSGALSERIGKIRNALVDAVAAIEVVLDYPEEDLEAATNESVRASVESAIADVDRLLATRRTGQIVRDGLHVALLGKPNVGKSSLLNALLGTSRAIVTEIAGTTRDTITETLVYRGVKFVLTDTAGLRESADRVEAEGIAASRRVAAGCDVAVVLVDDTFDEEDEAILSELDCPVLVVGNKSDLRRPLPARCDLTVSAATGENLDALKERLFSLGLDGNLIANGEILTNARHFAALTAARDALLRALDAPSLDLAPIDLREAAAALGKIDGATVSEEVTDRIFSKFCLGK